MAEWRQSSPTDVEGPRPKPNLLGDFSTTLSVCPAGTGYPALFKAGEDEGGEEEGWQLAIDNLLTYSWPIGLIHISIAMSQGVRSRSHLRLVAFVSSGFRYWTNLM